VKFNLLDSSYICVSGTINFTIEDVENLLNNSCDVTVSGGDDIYISCDLVDRVAIDQIKYYFSSSTSSGIIVPTIGFYYKNDLADDWVDLQTNIGSGYYYTTITSPSAPRYIKLHHTIASGIGTVKGFEVLNDDSVVDFGADGNLTSSTTLTTLSYLNYNDYIKEIEIYNNGSSTATAHIFIDPQYNDVDALLSISASEDGPWVFSRNIDYIISNANNWDCGQYNNTSTSGVADGKLRLNPGYTVGTYMTPIFKNDSVKFAYIDMLQTAVSGSIIAVDSDDYTSTLQIRSSHVKPIDYNVYRKIFIVSGNSRAFYYKDYLLINDVEVYNSYESVGYFDSYSFTSPHQIIGVCHINYINGKCFYLHSFYSGHSGMNYYYMHIYLLTHTGVQIFKRAIHYRSSASAASAASAVVVYFVEIDWNDGIWIYLWVEKGGTYDLTEAGYYLLHYSSSGSLLYKEYSSSNFISGCDPVKDYNGALWCSRITGTQTVLKIDSTGEILVSYDSVTDVGRLCSTEDGGCWFIDNNALYKLNSNGVLEDSITNLEITNSLNWVMRDESDDNFLWIVDGIYIKLISLDGRIYNSIYLGDSLSINRLHSISGGVFIYCTETGTGNHYIKFVEKMSGGVNKTILNDAAPLTEGVNYRTMKAISYDNPILGNIIPLSDDPVWNDTLEWNKAVTNNAVLPREEYNQLKLTLRRPNTGVPSPSVENIYYQDNVEIINIPPGQSKTLYLRISLPDGVTIGGNYESNLRVWWELPVV